MTPEQITQIFRETLVTAIQISSPFLILALVAGFVISILQSFMHIQEMTLSFAPKIILLTLLLAVLFPWVLKMMIKFTNHILIYQWERIFFLN
jgi:flagellar biosynthetic protein FliQ